MEAERSNKLELRNGSQIAVIGGGPAGSFFAYFVLEFAQRLGLNISVDIIEAKDFNCVGPSGCNNCGGLVSESLVQSLSTEGIVLPTNVIRRGIESYTLHLEQGTTVIETPLKEQRIVSMFRGAGPRGSTNGEQLSFDNYLLELCKGKGANIVFGKVTKADRGADAITLTTKEGLIKKYDLVVGAVGLNINALQLFKEICPLYKPPQTTKTHISEFFLGEETIDKYFGHSMHVFLLNLPNIKFGALIPKGKYVTMVLLGSDINKEVVTAFLNAKPVRDCFPAEIDLEKIIPCQCYPKINIQGGTTAYADRVILIGDSASSKLFKNGIGAAYITAKAAARTAVFEGVSEKDFKKHYKSVCDSLDRDNMVGKFIFSATTIIQKSHLLKKGLLSMVINEQKKPNEKRLMSSILWDTFTGSAPYTNILMRTLNPMFGLGLFGHTLKRTRSSTNTD